MVSRRSIHKQCVGIELNNITATMVGLYSTAKICPQANVSCDLEKEGLSLDPQIEGIMANSRSYDELLHAWQAWRDATGPKMRDDYETYVKIKNEAAILNGMDDYGALWRDSYESDHFVSEVDTLWRQLEPLYSELHTYVRRRLKEVYGDRMGDDGLIPAHLLGNMWAQSWSNIYDLVVPFPNATSVDVTSALKEKGYTARRMFEMADEFYRSLGLPTNNMSFDESRAMIEKPSDGRQVVCHASAWDFCDRQDFRIKMCTSINMKDFVTVHHEMGHIQYYIQYKDQPITFRQGANPGFHEAVGDTIALSVATTQHLVRVGLLDGDHQDSEESDLNSLMEMALNKVAFLPFGLLIDKWRWDVFSGSVSPQQWNSHWWSLRQRYQKVRAPVQRGERDFDPGAKYHIPGDSQYIAYFVAHVLQFQLHKALCEAAGQYNASDPARPLHKCDIYQSTAAGDKLRAGLRLGGSRHWADALQEMTGQRSVDGSALLEYFQPLHQWLKRSNIAAKDQTVPIVVAAVLLVLVVVVVGGYVVVRWRRARAARRGTQDEEADTQEMSSTVPEPQPQPQSESSKKEDK
ncbi:angiotensin-converting enzyme-like isoform X2 [Bacillus rossius redtenbacheri]|uniref:angiotensin-converting enzyme-like isoform X2 n=1 Tax=Bacillus rossius redtenbacheri TaxID=93214 RepID=UPI002FDF05EB